MKKFISAAIAFLAPISAFAAEHATGEHAGGHGDLFFEKLGIQIADFLVVIIPLMVILVPLVRRSLKKRHDDVTKMIDDARAVHASAQARLDAAEAHMRGIETEMESIKKSFREMGDSEKKAFEADAITTIEKMHREAEMRINQAGLAIQAQITDELIGRALAKVEAGLAAERGRPVSDDMVDRITDIRN